MRSWRLRGFPEITAEELVRFFTLTAADAKFVDPGRGRSAKDRLGLAVQLCSLPWLGFVPDDVTTAPVVAVERLGRRLGVDPGELGSYGQREQTRTDHVGMVARCLGWRPAGALEWKELEAFLLARAMEHDSPGLLFRLACEHLISAQVIRPGPVAVIERVATARAAACPTRPSPPSVTARSGPGPASSAGCSRCPGRSPAARRARQDGDRSADAPPADRSGVPWRSCAESTCG